jgi:type IV secretion system protein VirB11
MTPSEITSYIKNVVDIVVQLKRGGKGRRYISEVYFRAIHNKPPEEKPAAALAPVSN